MKKFLIIFACLFCALSLTAAKKKVVAPEPELVVSEQDCDYLTTYQPSADTEYLPAVDVHGKPVMEADLTPSVIKPPEKYSFDITVDVAKYMGLTVPAGLESKAKIGTIIVEKGQATFNGNPLEGDAEAALKALCKEQKEKKDSAAKVIDQK